MTKKLFLTKGMIVFLISILLLMPIGVIQSKKGSLEDALLKVDDGSTKIISLKADAGGISFCYGFSHLGPIWFASINRPLELCAYSGIQFRVNGKLQNVESPVWIMLRNYFGIGPSVRETKGVKAFGICKDFMMMPLRWLEDYIYDQPLFTVNDCVNLGQTVWGLASADFNNDGYPDFAVSFADGPFTHSTIAIFYNNGNGSFTRDDVYSFDYSYITDLNAGDYNNDGYVDLLFTHSEYTWYKGLPVNVNGTGKLLINEGNNHFTAATTAFWHGPGVPYGTENRVNPQLTSADFDMDGNLDFLVGDNSGKVELYDNDGSGDFTSPGIIHDWGACSWGLTSGDFDGDSDIDFLVSASYDDTNCAIYLIKNQIIESNGTTCFKPGSGEPLFGAGYCLSACPQFLDYNQDGKLDILVGVNDEVYLCINKNDSFNIYDLGRLPSNQDGYGDDLSMGAITSADFNSDGKDDILIGGVQGAVRLCLNNNSQQIPPFIPVIMRHTAITVLGHVTEFTFMTRDFNGAKVSYWVDWGDGTNTGWIGPFASDEEITLNHTWTKVITYDLKVKAKNNFAESEWKHMPIIVHSKSWESAAIKFAYPFMEKYDIRFVTFVPKINDFTPGPVSIFNQVMQNRYQLYVNFSTGAGN
jgi:hypothetical protein